VNHRTSRSRQACGCGQAMTPNRLRARDRPAPSFASGMRGGVVEERPPGSLSRSASTTMARTSRRSPEQIPGALCDRAADGL
jgi:hypothetical protein